MNLARRIGFTTFIILTLVGCPLAQKKDTTTVPSSAPVSDVQRRDIGRLLTGMKIVEQEKASLVVIIEDYKRSIPSIPAKVWEELSNELKTEFTDKAIIDAYIPIFARHFTDAEVKSLIVFYESPAGKKFTDEMPMVQAEAFAEGIKRGEKIGERIRQKLKAKGYNLNISE